MRPHAGLTLGGILLAASCIPGGAALEVLSAAALPPPALPFPAARFATTPSLSLDPAVLNAALPLAGGALSAAAPFRAVAGTALDQLRALDCLTAAVYHEAGNETEAGQRAVAQVVLNRVRHPAYPNSVCGVVYQGPLRADAPANACQFTFTCDGSLARTRSADGWRRARRIAADALAGHVFAPVGLSTHYHADYVLPDWAPHLARTAVIGAHIFYRWPGAASAPGAFTARYAGREAVPAPRAAPEGAPVAALASWTGPQLAMQPLEESKLPKVAYTASGLPESRVREEYRASGTWLPANR